MKRHPFLAALIAGLLGIAVGVRAQTSRIGRNQPSLSIGTAIISPTRLPASGGSVTLRLRVVPRLAVVRSVKARAVLQGSGTTGPTTTLTNLGNGNYSGIVSVPRNPSNLSIFANIVVIVDWTGGSPRTRTVGQVRLDGAGTDGNQPPPPPPI